MIRTRQITNYLGVGFIFGLAMLGLMTVIDERDDGIRYIYSSLKGEIMDLERRIHKLECKLNEEPNER